MSVRSVIVGLSMVATLLLAVPPGAQAAPNGYVQMSDGTLIAVNVRMPDGYVEGKRYPTLFEMSGYDGGSADGGTLLNDFGLTDRAGPAAATTAASSRKFFNRPVRHRPRVGARHRLLGRRVRPLQLEERRGRQVHHRPVDRPAAVVERRRRRSCGHSYGGITGFMIAATQPPHLRRGHPLRPHRRHVPRHHLPGRRRNYGFPLAWTGGIRPPTTCSAAAPASCARASTTSTEPGLLLRTTS